MATYIKSTCDECEPRYCGCCSSLYHALGVTSLNVSVTDSVFLTSGYTQLGGPYTGVFDLINPLADPFGHNPTCGSTMSDGGIPVVRTYNNLICDTTTDIWEMDVWVTNTIYFDPHLCGPCLCTMWLNQFGYASISVNGEYPPNLSGYFQESGCFNQGLGDPERNPCVARSIYGTHLITSYGSFLEGTPFVGILQTLTIS